MMRAVSGAAVLFSLLAAVASAALAQSLQPLVVDWQQTFRIESEPSTRDGRTVVKGTVWNTAPWGAKRIQLLVDALDASGQVVNQRVVWLGIDLATGTHAYFEVPMPSFSSYRVSIFAFDTGRGGRWSQRHVDGTLRVLTARQTGERCPGHGKRGELTRAAA